MIWFVVWCASARAADAMGATDDLLPSSPTLSFANVSVKGANGDLWLAGDFIDPSGNVNDPGVRVEWCAFTSPWQCNTKIVQAIGLLTNNGIYASILTWAGAANLLVTGKVDESVGQPHLRVITQDRDDFTQAATTATVTGTGTASTRFPTSRGTACSPRSTCPGHRRCPAATTT